MSPRSASADPDGQGTSDSAGPSGEVALDADASLDRAKSLYQDGRFDRCRQAYAEIFDHLSAAGEREASAETLEPARVYYASCLLAIGERELAETQVRHALEANPLMPSPDPVEFPSQVRDLFFTVKADFLDEVRKAQEKRLREAAEEAQRRALLAEKEQARVQLLEEVVATETLVHRNERWVAAVPFGVGQFQNGDAVLGGVFLTIEGLALGALVAGVVLELDTHDQAAGTRGVVGSGVRTAAPFNEALARARDIQEWSLGLFVFSSVIGLLEAQINFVPEHPAGTRRRQLPEPLQPSAPPEAVVRPSFSLSGSGRALLGVEGTF